jgi:gp16 family phage-associated protein
MAVSDSRSEEPWNDRVERVRLQFVASGVSVAKWSKERGFSDYLVRQVLTGKRAAVRGQSHQIAVALGLKPRVPVPGEEGEQLPIAFSFPEDRAE